MQRRSFVQLAGLGAVSLGSAGGLSCRKAAVEEQKPTRRRALMKVGAQPTPGPSDDAAGYSDDNLGVLAALGVNNINRYIPPDQWPSNKSKWSVEGLSKLKERVEKFGIKIDMVLIPLTHSCPYMLIGKSPERDREIDLFCETVRNVSKAGIPILQYYFTLVGVPRSGWKPVRGGARGGAFVYEEAKEEPPLTEAGPVSADQYWERITYVLKRVVPVAEEYKTRICCHPHDPAMPRGKTWRGVHRILTDPDALQRFLDIVPSKYHGLHVCQGTVSEMLDNPGKETCDVIRRFGSQGKIFGVHFRNIKGKRANFVETFIDDGDVDMLEAARAYRDVGYDGMLMPDHVPQIQGDPGGRLAFAYSYGYIKALIAAVDAEG